MKKTLLAVAVAAALPAVAFAQTNVTLYGIADAGVGWKDAGGPAKSTMFVDSGIQSTSRLGVRGSEDLGNGLRATFNLEMGVRFDEGLSDADVAGRTTWQRRSVVGLAGSWGEINLGRDYTPGFKSTVRVDMFGYGLYGNWLNFIAGQRGTGVRASNGLHYTGTFSGVTINAMYAEGETQSGKSSAGDSYGLSAIYAGGPLTVQGYFEQQKSDNLSGAKSIRRAGLGGMYNFGQFRLSANYGVVDPSSSLEAAWGAKKTQAYSIGGGVKVGVGEVLAQVLQMKHDALAGKDPKVTMFGLSYVHPLSKRTNLYASYGTAQNNSAGNFALLSSDTALAPGKVGADQQSFAVGIRHMF